MTVNQRGFSEGNRFKLYYRYLWIQIYLYQTVSRKVHFFTRLNRTSGLLVYSRKKTLLLVWSCTLSSNEHKKVYLIKIFHMSFQFPINLNFITEKEVPVVHFDRKREKDVHVLPYVFMLMIMIEHISHTVVVKMGGHQNIVTTFTMDVTFPVYCEIIRKFLSKLECLNYFPRSFGSSQISTVRLLSSEFH